MSNQAQDLAMYGSAVQEALDKAQAHGWVDAPMLASYVSMTLGVSTTDGCKVAKKMLKAMKDMGLLKKSRKLSGSAHVLANA